MISARCLSLSPLKHWGQAPFPHGTFKPNQASEEQAPYILGVISNYQDIKGLTIDDVKEDFIKAPTFDDNDLPFPLTPELAWNSFYKEYSKYLETVEKSQ